MLALEPDARKHLGGLLLLHALHNHLGQELEAFGVGIWPTEP